MPLYHKEPTSWDRYFLDLAHWVGTRSKCISRQVGAVLVKDRTVISTGYNGPPRGVDLCHYGKCIWPKEKRNHPCDLSGCPAAHGELNAIVQAARMGIETRNAVMYCNCPVPCKNCMAAIINAGVSWVYCIEREGKPLYYDELSQQYVESGAINVTVLTPYADPKSRDSLPQHFHFEVEPSWGEKHDPESAIVWKPSTELIPPG